MKMLSANFRKKLLEIYQKPMAEQKTLLEEYYNMWKGNREQVDDVLVIGFKFELLSEASLNGQGLKWKNKHILIAEDIDINYFLLVEALKSTKAHIYRVENGLEAIDYCKNNYVDLVLMDIHMPVMDGLEATKQIKSFKQDLPIIAQTALGQDEDIELIKDAGCNDYISKPIDLKTFLAMISKYLNK
jgi:CheY-like chemotaxis protein